MGRVRTRNFKFPNPSVAPRRVTHAGQKCLKFEINFKFDVPSRMTRIRPSLLIRSADGSIM